MNKIVLIIILVCIGYAAQATPVKKEKKITDRYATAADGKLIIANQYGKVHINTWDKDEISITIMMSVTSSSETSAQELLDDIDVQQQRADKSFSYRTVIKRKKLVLNDNKDIEINYMVNIPAYHGLTVNNRFGDVYLASHNGTVSLNVEYGAIKTEELSGKNTILNISFGSIYATKIQTANVEARYSKVTIESASQLTANNKFGKTFINNVDKLNLSQDYGEAHLTHINKLRGHISYADFSMDKPGTETDLFMQYCSHAELGTIGNDAEKISVAAKFSKLTATLGNDAGIDVDINAKFGKVNYKSTQAITLREIEEDSYTRSYRGKAGNGKTRVVMNMEYSNMSFK